MEPVIVSGSAHPALGVAVSKAMGRKQPPASCARFPDGEIRVDVRCPVALRDVYLLQPLFGTAGGHLLELLLLADACRRGGAARLTALVPYLGYARQDRRPGEGAPAAAGVIIRLLSQATDRLVVLDVHTPSLESASPVPFVAVSALSLLAQPFRENGCRPDVVVAPDHGAARRADRLGAILDRPSLVILKERLSPREVRAGAVPGDVTGARALVVDDMLSTGGTVEAAVRALEAAGALLPVDLAVTHGLFAGPALGRLKALPLGRVALTDSVPAPASVEGLCGLFTTVSIAPLLARVVGCLNEGSPLGPLLS